MEKMFEYAAKNKIRFNYKGLITIEDLFDLTRNALDTIYKSLVAQKKTEESEESLMDAASKAKTKEQQDLEAKIEIVKYVFSVKTQELLDKAEEKEKKEKKQKLLAIYASKQDEALQKMSMEDLEKMIAELG